MASKKKNHDLQNKSLPLQDNTQSNAAENVFGSCWPQQDYFCKASWDTHSKLVAKKKNSVVESELFDPVKQTVPSQT